MVGTGHGGLDDVGRGPRPGRDRSLLRPVVERERHLGLGSREAPAPTQFLVPRSGVGPHGPQHRRDVIVGHLLVGHSRVVRLGTSPHSQAATRRLEWVPPAIGIDVDSGVARGSSIHSSA